MMCQRKYKLWVLNCPSLKIIHPLPSHELQICNSMVILICILLIPFQRKRNNRIENLIIIFSPPEQYNKEFKFIENLVILFSPPEKNLNSIRTTYLSHIELQFFSS